MTRVGGSTMATAGRKLVPRALVLVQATIHVLSVSQSTSADVSLRTPADRSYRGDPLWAVVARALPAGD